MKAAALQPAALERVRAELEEIDGVCRAVIDGPPWVVYVIADRGARFPSEMVVHSVLFRHGLGPGDAELHMAYTGTPEPRAGRSPRAGERSGRSRSRSGSPRSRGRSAVPA